MNTTPYRWTNAHLKNLVQAAPTSPYTRALLRIKFNSPVPEECQTFEQIETWLALLPAPKPTPPKTYDYFTYDRNNPRQQEIDRGEYIQIQGRVEGFEIKKEYYRKSCRVKVPLSLFTAENHDEILDWVYSEVEESDPDYYDNDYMDGGDETDRYIEENLDDLIAEASTRQPALQ